jgi:hypothetical protein
MPHHWIDVNPNYDVVTGRERPPWRRRAATFRFCDVCGAEEERIETVTGDIGPWCPRQRGSPDCEQPAQ